MSQRLSIYLPYRIILAFMLVAGLVWTSSQTAVYAQLPETVDALLDTEPSFADDFSADLQFWTTPYDGETSRFLKSGRLHIVVDVENTVAYSRGDMIVDDFYAEVDTIHVAGNVSNQLGLIFRLEDENNFYFFAIGNDGYYALLKLENNSWNTLVSWTESDVVRSGSAGRNRVGVLAEGSEFTLLVNDEVVAQAEDHSFAAGQIALTAGSYENPGIEIAFDNFAVWRLGEPIADSPVAPPPALSQIRPDETADQLLDYILEVRTATPDYEESFADGDGGWDVFQTDHVFSRHTEDGLVITVDAPQILGSSVFPRVVNDFYMEVDIAHLAGPTDAEVGVVFREVDSTNYYFYAINHDGYFSLWRKRSDEWQAVADWELSTALATGDGARNTLGLLAQGERIVLLANDVVLSEVTDAAFSSGTIALLVGTFDEPDAEIAFEGVYIWDLEMQAPSLPPAQRDDDTSSDTDTDTDGDTGPDTPETDPEATTPEDTSASGFDAQARVDAILDTPSTFFDDFRRNTGVWEVVDEEDFSFTYRQRAFLAVVDRPQWVAWTALLRPVTDYYFEVDATQLSDVQDASYGLIFRLQDSETFYQFSISSEYGSYSVWSSLAGEWSPVIMWTESDAINTSPQATNRLGILVEGSNAAFFINGEWVDTAGGLVIESGTIGLAAETFEEVGQEVLFDNAELWELR